MSLAVACFISSHAQIHLLNHIDIVHKLGGKVFYVDTDSIMINIRLPDFYVHSSEIGKLKFIGSFDRCIILGKKQFYLENTETGQKEISSKGYDKESLTYSDWLNASKGKTIKTTHLDIIKEDHTKIHLLESVKEFKLSLKGRIFIDNSILKPIHLSSPQERLHHSLVNSPLDDGKIRRISLFNSKGASKDWNKDIIESRTISNILSDLDGHYNYSLRTGQVFDNKNHHLIILDIDRKKISEQIDSLIQKILSQFHEYFLISTPSKGYHIYFLVESQNRIKSQTLTLKDGKKLSIEILAENKKVM